MKRIGVLLFVLLAAGACDSGEAEPLISGRYTGRMFTNGITVSVDVTLTENQAGSITGNGSISAVGTSDATTVTGTHAHPSVALTFAVQGFEDFVFSGTANRSGQEIAGTVNGSGFTGVALVLSR